jgi:hypothetical protein
MDHLMISQYRGRSADTIYPEGIDAAVAFQGDLLLGLWGVGLVAG